MSNTQAASQIQAGEPDPSTRPWLRSYDPGVPHTITYPNKPLTWLLDETTRTHGNRDAIIYFGHRFTYAQLAAMAERFAGALIKLGVKPGDRVSIALPNIPQFPIAFYGVLKAGAIAVATNPIYTESELQHQLADAGAETIVLLDMLYHKLLKVRQNTPIKRVIVAGVQDYLPPLMAAAYALQQRGNKQDAVSKRELHEDQMAYQFKDLLGKSDDRWYALHALPAPAKPDDVAVLQYTGGTTGLSKGAMLTHRNLLANALQVWAWTGIQDSTNTHETMLCAAPFFHSYGLTVAMNSAIIGGSTLVLMPRFKAKDAVKMIQKYHPTLFPGVPTMYLSINQEVEAHGGDLRSVRICISGAAPLPKEVQNTFERFSGGKMVEGYGLSETSPVTHCNPLNGERRTGIGLPLPDTEATIQDSETGEILPSGQAGEICIRGPQVMKGYWNRPEETDQMLRGGWLHTGDIGIMDEDGYFQVVDRAKDMIIASGYKIFPREVEEVLYGHPKIAEAVLVGIPDAYRGETAKVYIVLKPDQQATADEIMQFCKEHLAPYKVPKQIEFRSELPKTMIGKVLRRALREEEAAKQAQGKAG